MQFSFFDRRPLFDPHVLHRCRTEWRRDPVEGLRNRAQALTSFLRELTSARKRTLTKETALEQAFNNAFFVELLGFQLYPGENNTWTAWPKPPSTVTHLSGEPDLILGTCSDDGFQIGGVVELKKPGTPLDAPQPAYDNRSPVEQAFDYARSIGTCKWVIVTDMLLLWLYSVESPRACHEIDLSKPADGDEDSILDAFKLLSYENLIRHGDDSPTSRLLNAVRREQTLYRDAFYGIYSQIRDDLLGAVEGWSGDEFDRQSQILSVQRLLDRLLFIFFCEDHPDRLLTHGLLEGVVSGALSQPGASRTKAYDSVKQLFRDLDTGVATEFWSVPRYNGELFKWDKIVDELSLDDSLQQKRYHFSSTTDAPRRTVRGVFGLHVFDFWRELDRDLLGNLFERSIGDLTALAHGGRPDARKAFGVFYTASSLARFVARSAVEAMLGRDTALSQSLRKVSSASSKDADAVVENILHRLKQYRIADLTCGSGVFLTTALDALLDPYRKALEAITAGALTREMHSIRQAEVLKSTIFGIDLLPQAVELAKLALWLTAARRNEPSADLSENFVTGDALQTDTLQRIQSHTDHGFDLILGNPPWGGDYDEAIAAQVLSELDLEHWENCDSWELFLCLAVSRLKPQGRFALLLPDTIFSAEKSRVRQWLVTTTELEKVYALGPDWFTSDVRMGTVVVQGVRRPPRPESKFSTLVLAGRERLEVQQGLRPLEQLEQTSGQKASQKRFEKPPDYQIHVLSSDGDLDLISRMEAQSIPIKELTEHARGDEINADGLVWHCGGCGAYTVPGAKRKGGGYADKLCPQCQGTLSEKDAFPELLVAETQHGPYQTPWVDGSELTRRYENPTRKFIRTDLQGLNPPLKPREVYRAPKILIRQAGVGVVATVVDDICRCPQSVYIYRVSPTALDRGYSDEFILACLVSRTMNYIVMQKYAEIDPARAFAKLTHARIEPLPIPKIQSQEHHNLVSDITALVRNMLANPEYGGTTDLEIELRLRQLWGISGDEGRYVNGFFSMLPVGQAVEDLFPTGAPTRVPFPTA